MKLIFSLLFCSLAFSQARIVHVAGPQEASGNERKMPNLQGTVVGMEFGGFLANQVRGILIKKGVRDFTEGPNPCHIEDRPVICFSISRPESEGQRSEWVSSNFGSSSASGNWNLEKIDVLARADLVRPTGERIPLGWAIGYRDAGSENGWSSNSGRRYSSSESSSTITTKESAAARAARMAVMRLVDNYTLWELGGHTKGWYPNATAEIALAFPRSSPAPKPASTKDRYDERVENAFINPPEKAEGQVTTVTPEAERPPTVKELKASLKAAEKAAKEEKRREKQQ